MNITELHITKHISIGTVAYDGWQWSISGLGLSKVEREFFGDKFLQINNHVNVYMGRLILTYSKENLLEHLKSVNIYINKPVKEYVTEWFKYMRNKVIDKIKHIPFSKQYNFCMDKYWEGDYKFTSDMLSAFQLASNYEADLYLNGRLIFSPLGLDWEDNKKLIIKYLGKRFVNEHRFNLMGYKDPWSKEIKNYTKLAREY
jgi:hypothetical protein